MKYTYARIGLEFLNAPFSVNRGEPYLELCEGSRKHVQEVSKLGKYDRLCPRIILTNPEDVTRQSVDLGAERTVHVNVLDLTQHSVTDARIDRGRALVGDMV